MNIHKLRTYIYKALVNKEYCDLRYNCLRTNATLAPLTHITRQPRQVGHVYNTAYTSAKPNLSALSPLTSAKLTFLKHSCLPGMLKIVQNSGKTAKYGMQNVCFGQKEK